LMSAVLNFAGAFISIGVAVTIAKGIVNPAVLAGGWGDGAGVGGIDRAHHVESDHVVSGDFVEFVSRVDRWGDRSVLERREQGDRNVEIPSVRGSASQPGSPPVGSHAATIAPGDVPTVSSAAPRSPSPGGKPLDSPAIQLVPPTPPRARPASLPRSSSRVL
jgi:hypothetical protein